MVSACLQVFSVALVKDPQNPANNRGYCFVKYQAKEAAITALDRLHNREIPGHPNHKARPCCACYCCFGCCVFVELAGRGWTLCSNLHV